MKIIDFDAKFFEYAQKWVASHPGLTEQQVEDSYNTIMEEWSVKPAKWLDGAAPCDYFKRFESADALIELMRGYSEKDINLPEPLYTRIVELGEACAPALDALLKDESAEESLRAEAMGMLRDIGWTGSDPYLIQLVTGSRERNELSDMAADILSGRGEDICSGLLDAYPESSDYAQMLIMDICCCGSKDTRVFDYLVNRLKNRPDERALCASYLAKFGDDRAIEPLKQMLDMFDLSYFDYIELRAAVETLGGDAGEDRTFYGDPDYEALRNLE